MGSSSVPIRSEPGERGPRRVRVAADYAAFPVWDVERGGMVDPSELPVPAPLRERLESWAADYDATLVAEDPLASGFATADDEREFLAHGRALAVELQQALGATWHVTFGDD